MNTGIGREGEATTSRDDVENPWKEETWKGPSLLPKLRLMMVAYWTAERFPEVQQSGVDRQETVLGDGKISLGSHLAVLQEPEEKHSPLTDRPKVALANRIAEQGRDRRIGGREALS